MKPSAVASNILAKLELATGDKPTLKKLLDGRLVESVPKTIPPYTPPDQKLPVGGSLPLPLPKKEEKEEIIDLPPGPPKLSRQAATTFVAGFPDAIHVEEAGEEEEEEGIDEEKINFYDSIDDDTWAEIEQLYKNGMNIMSPGKDGIPLYLLYNFNELEAGYIHEEFVREIQPPSPTVEVTPLQPIPEGTKEGLEVENAEGEVKGPEWLSDNTWETNKKFRISCRRLFFTYRTHLNKDKYETFLRNIASKSKQYKEEFCRIFIAHEVGKTGYVHTHVFCDFGFLFTSSGNPRVFDFDEIHPHLKTIQSKQEARTLRYISKQDPELAAVKAVYAEKEGEKKESFTVRLSEAKSKAEVVRMATNPAQVNGMLRAWEVLNAERTVFDPLEGKELRPWQNWLLKFIEQKCPSGRRALKWITDKFGGSGKSTFARHLEVLNRSNKRFDYAVVCGGKAADVSSQIGEHLDNGWSGHCIIFDLPRDTETKNDEIYTVIENCLDGRVNISKYNSRVRSFNPPWVVVFANFTPKIRNSLGQPTMSRDRWTDCWSISWDYISHPNGPPTPPAKPSGPLPAALINSADLSPLTLKDIEDSKSSKDKYIERIRKNLSSGMPQEDLNYIKDPTGFDMEAYANAYQEIFKTRFTNTKPSWMD